MVLHKLYKGCTFEENNSKAFLSLTIYEIIMERITVDLGIGLSTQEIAKQVSSLLLPEIIKHLKLQIEAINSIDKDLPIFIKPGKSKELFGVSGDSIRKMVKEGKINGYYPTKDLMVKVSEVVDFFELNKIESYD